MPFFPRTWLVLTLIIFSPLSQAQEGTSERAKELGQNLYAQTVNTLSSSKSKREELSYFILGNYSPIDLIIPSKMGLTFGSNRSSDNSWELEYLKGSISVPFIVEDLGQMSDTRISLIKRSYFGSNSFNLNYGLSFFDFKLFLGDELLSRLTSGAYPAVDLIHLQSLGLNLGIGNRWTFANNWTLGVDWISWSQPFYILKEENAFLDYATNENDREDVETAVDVISFFPRLQVLKLQLGYSF